jgi:peptidoglycan/LPS O-acetylase OafA/YrhL
MKAGAARLPEARIDFIDGFRGVAIILVICFHYFSRFSGDSRDIYPYGDVLSSVRVFEFGYYGVHLFFAVSGFVIAMTLERTSTFHEFAVKRFARLWPAMLLCASLTYLVLSIWPFYWPQRIVNFFPSLTFLDGGVVWERVAPGLNAEWIDGAYWSLFVEVRFYLYAGAIYFLSRKHFARNMLAFILLTSLVYAICVAIDQQRWSAIVHDLLIAPYLPWFGIGLAAFEAWRGGVKRAGLIASTSMGAVALLAWLDVPAMNPSVALLVTIMFASSLWLAPIRRLFSVRWLALVGVSSYSLYLLHQNMGLTLIAVLAKRLNLYGVASLLLPVLVGAGMIGIAYAIYRYWELPWNRRIVRWHARSALKPVPANAKDSAA